MYFVHLQATSTCTKKQKIIKIIQNFLNIFAFFKATEEKVGSRSGTVPVPKSYGSRTLYRRYWVLLIEVI